MSALNEGVPAAEYSAAPVASPPAPNLPSLGGDNGLTSRADLDTFIDRGTMPFWTTQDTRSAILSTLIPGGAALTAFAVFVKDAETVNWWTNVKRPSWAPSDVRLYSTVDVLTLSPLGYASYLVYKNGGGFDYNDTRLALALYGTNIALALATIPLVKKRNLNCLANNTILLHLTAAATAFAFYKIDKAAGLWMLPYAAWTGFYAFLTYAIKKENQAVKDL